MIKMEEGRSAFKILTAIPTGNGPLGKPRRRWKDNIIIDLKEISITTRNSEQRLSKSPCKYGI